MNSRDVREFWEKKRKKRTNAAYLGEKRRLPFGTKHVSWVLDQEWCDYSPSLATGFRGIDSFARLNAGEVVLLASRQREEERALAMNIALHVSDQGSKVLYLSLDENREAVAQRLLAIASGLPLSDMARGTAGWYRIFNAPEWDLIADADERLATSGIYLCDDPSLDAKSLAALTASIDSLDSPMLVIVDCVQLLGFADSCPHSGGEPVGLSNMLTSLKSLAMDLNVAVLGLGGIPQASSCADVSSRLSLDDLRAAGLGEKDANVVMILNGSDGEEGADEPAKSEWRTTRVTVIKTNGGASYETPLLFNPKTLRFADSLR